MSSPSQEHSSTHLQRLRAVRLEPLINYVAEYTSSLRACLAASLSLCPVYPPTSAPESTILTAMKTAYTHLKHSKLSTYLQSRPVILHNKDELRN
jgi:hypothetical protein